jgi:MFS family permease
MTIAVIEGVVVAAMLVTVESFIVPLLQKRLGASASIIGLLTIVPMIGSSFAGLVVGPVIRALGGNKRCVLITCAIQIAALAGLGIPIHYPERSWAVPVALGLAISIALVGSVGGPAWISWMGSLVPRRLQGRYLSFRNRLLILVKLGFAAAFAQVIYLLPENQGPWGLQIVLAVGALSRLASMWMIARQHDPAPRPKLSSHDSQHLVASGGMLHFLRTIFRTDLGRWTAVWATLHFGVMISGPYTAVYMLALQPDGLGLSAWPYIILLQTATVTRLVVFPFVGRLIDLFGPAAMLRVAVAGITLIPLPWAFATSLPILIATEVASGLCWCVAEIAVGVLLFSCHRDPGHRSRLIGYHQTVVAAVAALSATCGSILLAKDPATAGALGDLLPPIAGSSFHTLFLISMVMRIPAVIFAIKLLPGLRELRDEEHAGLWRLIPGTDLALGLSRGLMGFFRRPEG